MIKRREKYNYEAALLWLMHNSDNTWIFGLNNQGSKSKEGLAPTEVAIFVAAAYGRTIEELAADLTQKLSFKRSKAAESSSNT